EPLDANHTLKDFSVDTYRRMAIDCAVFIQKATPILTGLDMHEIIPAADGHSYTRWEMVAHDFWMTRQGHGTGFWDRPSYVYPPQVGKRLTALAKDFQPMTLEVSGNGKTINHL
ncbi:hypothetical protein EBT16_09865, partial [bacterium]|nr:hypothetical protein [bacterium]